MKKTPVMKKMMILLKKLRTRRKSIVVFARMILSAIVSALSIRRCANAFSLGEILSL